MTTRAEITEMIVQHRDALNALGVAHLWLFGSIARDEARALSDVDVVVDTVDGTAPGLFALARIKEQLEAVLGRPVDVISRLGLEHAQSLAHRVTPDLIDVF